MSSELNWSPSAPQSFFDQRFREGMLAMIAEVDRRAKNYAPIGTYPEDKHPGALKNSGQFRTDGRDMVIDQFGNARVRYARRRHFENKRNPQTLRYLERAAREVASGSLVKYFK